MHRGSVHRSGCKKFSRKAYLVSSDVIVKFPTLMTSGRASRCVAPTIGVDVVAQVVDELLVKIEQHLGFELVEALWAVKSLDHLAAF